MRPFVAYYRVSTDRQGSSGLGLEAQRMAVLRHIDSAGALLSEFVEVESGRSHANRPQLTAAMAECRKHKATLLIAKLDRLSRNVHFITGLIESRVDFVCCDNPHANKAMLQLLAVFAEYEREMISKRIKEALAAAKARGVKLGNPRLAEARIMASLACRADPLPEVLAVMKEMRGNNKTLTAIADRLNRLNIRTPRGSLWYAESIKRALRRNAMKEITHDPAA